MNGLTPKQQQIMALSDKGYSSAHIAEELNTTETSVKAQLTRIRNKVKAGKFQPAPLPMEATVK